MQPLSSQTFQDACVWRRGLNGETVLQLRADLLYLTIASGRTAATVIDSAACTCVALYPLGFCHQLSYTGIVTWTDLWYVIRIIASTNFVETEVAAGISLSSVTHVAYISDETLGKKLSF